MQERDISRADVKNGIATGEIIEDYPDDFPNPSCLIELLLGFQDEKEFAYMKGYEPWEKLLADFR